MKKFIIFATILSMLTLTANSASPDTGSWYQYNGYSTAHSFSLKFPTDWKVRTFGEDLQGFAPQKNNDEVFFTVQEFEGMTYNQAINSYSSSEHQLLDARDVVLSFGSDLIGKEATFANKNNGEEFKITFIKRGSLIVGLGNSAAGQEYADIVQAIFESFTFTDSWRQYIDYGDNYTFIYPSNLKFSTISGGVKLYDPIQFNNTIFTALKYGQTSIKDVAKESEGYNEDFISQEDIVFHGLTPAIQAIYEDENTGKTFGKIFVEKSGNSFGLTNVNLENNFPHMNYYDDYIVEILESFEFFNVEGEHYSYVYFPDVRDDHANVTAVNALTKSKVIAGYPDGTFKPDGQINRAELTKMIVATRTTPVLADYSNCFPDVKNEWFAPYVCYAQAQGWVEGYDDGTFKPEQNINRVEAIKILLEVLYENIPESTTLKNTTVQDVDQTAWYARYFNLADNKNFLDKQHIQTATGGYLYLPGNNISRKEVAESIYRIIKASLLP